MKWDDGELEEQKTRNERTMGEGEVTVRNHAKSKLSFRKEESLSALLFLIVLLSPVLPLYRFLVSEKKHQMRNSSSERNPGRAPGHKSNVKKSETRNEPKFYFVASLNQLPVVRVPKSPPLSYSDTPDRSGGNA